MIKFRFFAPILLLLMVSTMVDAQTIEKIAEAELKSSGELRKFKNFRTENTSNFDVTQYDLYFDLTDDKTQFSGSSTVYATILQETDHITLNAQSNLNISSVTQAGNAINFEHDKAELIISLDKSYSVGQEIVVKIDFNSNYSNARGITVSYHGNEIPIIATLSEPEDASSWWVCANNLYDKADIVNIKIKHHSDYKVGSNGSLISRETQSDGNIITHWRTSYPIPAYLVSLAMSNYVEYNNTASVSGTAVPITNYIYPENNTAAVKAQLDDVPGFIEYLSSIVGDYPYKNEKYGHSQWNWGGGMEHATMSSQVNFGTALTAHELAHQWFGDKITCGTWSDIWLNEGFATYFEGLIRRHYYGEEFFTDWKGAKNNYIVSQANGSVYIPDNELNENRIFSSRLSYSKGAMVLNMLKFRLGEETFFSAINQYLEDPTLSYGFAITDDLQRHLEQESGENLDEFFADWVYGEGHPIFDIQLNLQTDKRSATLIVNQQSSHSSVSFFETPFEVELLGVNGQREIRRFNLTQNNQTFQINNVPFDITSYLFNPHNDVICKVSSKTLGVDDMVTQPEALSIYPNPASHHFFILNNSQIRSIKIFDVAGKLVKEDKINSFDAEVNIENLPQGIYMLQAETAAGPRTKKLIKK